MINLYVGRARVELLSSSSFSDWRADRLHHRPMYGSLPICHNDFINEASCRKALVETTIYEAEVGVKPTYQDFADPDLNRSDTQPYLHIIFPNIYHHIYFEHILNMESSIYNQ